MELRYRILNVFTAGGVRLSGNPLAVVEDGSALDPAAMQALARQFNLSETTFICRRNARGAGPHLHARVRDAVRRPSDAGHRACVPRARPGRRPARLEMRAGIIPVTSNGNHWTLRAAPSTSRLVEIQPTELARLLASIPPTSVPATVMKAGANSSSFAHERSAVRRFVRSWSCSKDSRAWTGQPAYVFASMVAGKS
jgi:predicted PhzF superfamily epimerase YddE/YHI9